VTRINNHQLVQKLDDGVVIIDESAGEEVVIAQSDLPAVIAALRYFELPFPGVPREPKVVGETITFQQGETIIFDDLTAELPEVTTYSAEEIKSMDDFARQQDEGD
jgi:hypothetical protein